MFDAAAMAQDDGTVGGGRERGGLPVDFKELRLARAGLAAIVVEGMDGDAEAGGVGGAGLAAGGEVLGQNEELLTGAAGAFHPYTSAHGGGRGKAGVSRSHTVDPSDWHVDHENGRRRPGAGSLRCTGKPWLGRCGERCGEPLLHHNRNQFLRSGVPNQ